ncbi:hypothetical protein AMATHDRAFT_47262 [Amanita thiersii Skay4041]|uniref:Uncharacterized protein n=1 Tax=Amanita thiersii Skay4041 TaxID=703135 RepID=A0A2A9NPI7_9AGAR|nr:hypothetical protein AMATHDRAFT_47262 [Amanita thiersii Skay4041]
MPTHQPQFNNTPGPGDTSSSRSSSRLSHYYHGSVVSIDRDEDHDAEVDVDDDILDEDSTARLRSGAGIGKLPVAAVSSENVAALKKARSLAERNRLALNKLSSIARLTSPTPSSTSSSRHSRTSTAPTSVASQPPTSSPPSSVSTNRSQRAHARVSLPPSVGSPSQEQTLSGSETERESTSGVAYSGNLHRSLYSLPNPNTSNPALYHTTQSISSSSSSSTPLSQAAPPPRSLYNNNNNNTNHPHISTLRPATPSLDLSPPQSDLRPQHHRILSLASASMSTPCLPSTSTSRNAFQTPPPPQIAKTRSSGSTPASTSSAADVLPRKRMTSNSTSSGSSTGPQRTDGGGSGRVRTGTGSGGIGGRKSQEGSTGSGSSPGSPRRRRGESGGSVLATRGLTSMSTVHDREVREEEGRQHRDPTSSAPSRRRNTIREGAVERDVTEAALLAVAASRASNAPDSIRRRSALPKEFREDLDDDNELLDEDTMDPTAANRNSVASSSTLSARTLRELDQESRSSKPSLSLAAYHEWDRQAERERRQSLRGGSADSALAVRGGGGPGRSLVGEGLKAAGLSPKRDRTARRFDRERAGSVANGNLFGVGDRKVDLGLNEDVRPVSEFGERRERVARMREKEREMDDERVLLDRGVLRPATSLSRIRYSSSRSRSRARTSGTGFSEDEDDDHVGGGDGDEDVTRTAPPATRAYRNSYSTPRDREREIAHHSLTKRGVEKDGGSGRSLTSMSRYYAYATPNHPGGPSSSSSSTAANSTQNTLPLQDRSRTSTPYGSRRYSSQVPYQHTGGTSNDGERSTSRASSCYTPLERTEHARLMLDALTMFEGQMARIPGTDGRGGGAANLGGLAKLAQGIVAAADRLNAMLRAASKAAMDEQIDAEVADDVEAVAANERGMGDGGGLYSARDMVEVWKRVYVENKESVKVSDELVRSLTGFLLGAGRVIKELAGAEGGGSGSGSVVSQGSSMGVNGGSGGSMSHLSAHARSVSLNEEEIGRSRGVSPTLSGGGLSGRRSVDLARRSSPVSATPAVAAAREEAHRRLVGRVTESTPDARTRERYDRSRFESSSPQEEVNMFTTPLPSRSVTSLSTYSSSRRLFLGREQREMEQQQQQQQQEKGPSTSRSMSMSMYTLGMVPSDSQETVHAVRAYEPSPSPAPRTREPLQDSNRTTGLLPLKTPKPLPSLPSESQMHIGNYEDHSGSMRERERRKTSNTSIATVRGAPSYPMALSNPGGGGVTTAITPHTVSNSDPEEERDMEEVEVPSARSESRRSVRSSMVTFSRPSTDSVLALSGVQQQFEERQLQQQLQQQQQLLQQQQKRMAGSASKAKSVAARAAAAAAVLDSPMSGSETERPPKRQTFGPRMGSALRGRMASESHGSVGNGGSGHGSEDRGGLEFGQEGEEDGVGNLAEELSLNS